MLSQLLARVVEKSVGRELGLSSRQWRVLVMLNRLGPATSGQVAAATRLDHSQVSRASHELVEKGLVAMDSDLEDRRRQRLSVTAVGTQVLRRGIVGSTSRQARLQARLSETDHEVFSRVLTALTDEAQQMLAEERGQAVTACKAQAVLRQLQQQRCRLPPRTQLGVQCLHT